MAACSAPGTQAGSDRPHYYCAARTSAESGPTLVGTEQVFSFDGPVSSFPAEAPKLQASFASYAENTWAGMTIAPICHAAATKNAAETARGARSAAPRAGYAIMRPSYWRPG